MTEHKSTPKQPAAEPRHSTRHRVVVHGKIVAGRDVIVGDQRNVYYEQATPPASRTDFVAALQTLHQEITARREQGDVSPAQLKALEAVAGQLEEAIAEARKSRPTGERVTAALSGAKTVMESVSGGLSSALTLGERLTALIPLALRLFGG